MRSPPVPGFQSIPFRAASLRPGMRKTAHYPQVGQQMCTKRSRVGRQKPGSSVESVETGGNLTSAGRLFGPNALKFENEQTGLALVIPTVTLNGDE